MSVAPFTDLFGGHVQEGMLANVKSLESRWTGIDFLSNPKGTIIMRGEAAIISTFHLKDPQLLV